MLEGVWGSLNILAEDEVQTDIQHQFMMVRGLFCRPDASQESSLGSVRETSTISGTV